MHKSKTGEKNAKNYSNDAPAMLSGSLPISVIQKCNKDISLFLLFFHSTLRSFVTLVSVCWVPWFSGRVFAIFYDSTLHKYDLLVLVIFVTSILRISFLFFYFLLLLLRLLFAMCSAVIRFRSVGCRFHSSLATKAAAEVASVEMQTREFIPCDCFVCCRCVCYTRDWNWNRSVVDDDVAGCDSDCDVDQLWYVFWWWTQFCTIYFHTTHCMRYSFSLRIPWTENCFIVDDNAPNTLDARFLASKL